MESFQGDNFYDLGSFDSLTELMDECGIIDIPVKVYMRSLNIIPLHFCLLK